MPHTSVRACTLPVKTHVLRVRNSVFESMSESDLLTSVASSWYSTEVRLLYFASFRVYVYHVSESPARVNTNRL